MDASKKYIIRSDLAMANLCRETLTDEVFEALSSIDENYIN